MDTLRQKWLEATAPVPPPPAEKAKPKLTEEDWERIRAEKEKTRNNLQSLKERIGIYVFGRNF